MRRSVSASSFLLCAALFSPAMQAEDEVRSLPTLTVTGGDVTSIPLESANSAGSRLGVSLLETPASVDVLTQDKMYERGHTTTQQALDAAAGVHTGQCFGGACFIMRGFSDILSLPFLHDGKRVPGVAFSPRATFVYDRIEVIKGPNSVLHGLGGITGAVNFVTKKADGRESTDIEIGFGDAVRRSFGIGSGGKLGEDAAYRVDAKYMAAREGSFGWADNTAYIYHHVSGDLAFKLTDDLTVGVTLDSHNDKGDGYYGVPRVNGKVDKRTRFNNYAAADSDLEIDVTWAAFRVDWRINERMRLYNETYRNDEDRYYRDYDTYVYNPDTELVDVMFPVLIQHYQRLYGNRTEFSLDHSLGNMRNRFLIGADYYYNYHQREDNRPFSGGVSVDLLNPQVGPYESPDPYRPQTLTEITGLGFYVDDLLDLTDKFKVNLSFRHDKSDVDSDNLVSDVSFSKSYSTDSWRIGALYDIAPKLMVYGQVGRAVETPGQIVTLAQSQADFKPASATQMELGLKGSLFDGRADVTVAVFDILKKNLLTRDANDPASVVQIGEQSSRGVELAGSFRPTQHWSIDASMAFFDPQYEEFNDPVDGESVSRKGNRPVDVPEEIGNVWVTWRPDANWRFGLGARYVGERFADRANTVTSDSYTVVDANIGRRLGIGELTLNVRNLADEFYVLRSYSAQQGIIGEALAFDLIWAARI